MNTQATRIVRSTAARRQEIVEAAFLCLKDDGYAALTARKVASRAGISLGHITYHFRSMTEVLAETYVHASKLLGQETTRLSDRPDLAPIDRLRAFLDAGFTPAILERGYLRVRVDLWSAAIAYPELAVLERELYARYRSVLSAHLGALSSVAEPARVEMVTDTIMATLDGLWVDWLRREDRQALTNALNGCLDLARTLLEPTAAGRP